MADFKGAVPETMHKGRYIYQLIIGTGTANFQMSLNQDNAFEDIPNGSFSVSDTNEIALPLCRFRANLTGDATLTIVDLE